MTGTGILSVMGGDATGSTTCLGGGGAGGRIAVHYTNFTYSGTKDAYGGRGYECGGAGTVLFKDLSDNSNSLLVDNNHVCSPLKPNINFNELSDIGRKEYSFHTWVFDHSDCDQNVGCSHSFKEITVQGKAHVAVHRRNIDTHTQYITIYKTSGDKTGTFHVGPHQELTADLPEDSPELQYGLIIYPDGQMQTARDFVVNNITVELEGILTGVENLRIGPGGHVIIKPYGNATTGVTKEITFTEVIVEGGGILEIDSGGDAMKLIGTKIHVESGGIIQSDFLDLIVSELIVDDSAQIHANHKASSFGGGTGVADDKAGAGHGGMGGKGTVADSGGYFYGDVKSPRHFGSNAKYSETEVYGGGIINIVASVSSSIDGTISCNGEDGKSGSGGASGGSIRLQTGALYGKGKLQVNGGQGSSGAGGGAGGRLAVYYTSSEYTGDFTAYGGHSSSGYGGAGTVYESSSTKTKLIIDNKEVHTVQELIVNMDADTIFRSDGSRTWITFDSSNTLEVSELYLRKGAHLALEPSSSTSKIHSLTAQSFYGDDDFVTATSNIGTVHVGVYQVITIRQVSLYFPAHAKVYTDGTLTLPSTVKMYATNNLVHGKLGGLQDLTMIKSTFDVRETGKSHTTPSTFQLSNLYLRQGSEMIMTDDVQYNLAVSKLLIGASCEITAGKLTVEATEFESEEGGVINLNAMGDMDSGDGYASNNAGAGHGGEGGGIGNGTGGSAYDSYLKPSSPGSGGVSTHGGGVLHIQVTTFTHKGDITADGEHANVTSGGASGGSVWVSTSTTQVTGTISVNGGNGMSGGGGGGGLIAMEYISGNINGNLRAYGGNGEGSFQSGAAGVVYLAKDINSLEPDRKIIINNREIVTNAISRIPVPITEFSVTLDKLQIETKSTVAFTERGSVGFALSATVGDIIGETFTTFTVDKYNEVYLSTKYPSAVSELTLKTSIHVSEYGKLELPENVVIDKDHLLEICGTLMPKTNNLYIRDSGIVKAGNPARTGSSYVDDTTTSVLTFSALIIDHNGKFEHSDKCLKSNQATTLITHSYNTSGGYAITESGFDIQASETYEISPLLNATCDSSTDLLIYRDTQCELAAKAYSYASIVIEAGGKLILSGDPNGKNFTKITVTNLEIKYGGIIEGIGKGYRANGPGAAGSSSAGASYGGSGKNNPNKIHGNIISPKAYGSNGFGASLSSGSGGGQIELSVTNKFTLNGEINVNGQNSATSGGSGGSILVTAKDMSGTGTLSAVGGAGGGGGGRISVKISGTYSYKGDLTAAGNDASPGTVYVSKVESGSQYTMLIIDQSGTTEVDSVLSLPSSLNEVQLTNDASLSLRATLTINKLISDGSGSVTVANNAQLTISEFDELNHGCQCNFDIESGSTLRVNTDFDLTGSNPTLNLHGTLIAQNFRVLDHGTVTIEATGILQVTSFQLQEYTMMELKSGATYSNVQYMMLGYNSTLILHDNPVSLSLTTFHMKVKSSLFMKSDEKSFTLVATDVTIEDDAVLSVSASGSLTGSGVGNAENGASYGGEGGGSMHKTYGSTTSPTNAGSGCTTVRGGGIISIIAPTISIDGVVSADGGDSESTGGGSGGSIKINGDSLEGHGTISVNGGTSTNKGGGGGGRMALDVKVMTSFFGATTAFGGAGGTKHGAAGSVYKQYQLSGGALKTELLVDNNKLVTDSRTVINSITTVSELELARNAKVVFDSSGSSNLEIELIEGDYTGLLTVQATQYFVVATSYGTQYPFSLPCKMLIENGGFATLPAKLLLQDETDDEELNLDIQGNVIALRHLIVGLNAKAYISYNAHSGLTTTQLSDLGTFSITNLDVTTDGKLDVAQDSSNKYTLEILSELNIKYGGEMSGRNLYIDVPTLHVAYNGLLSVDGGNHEPGSGVGQDGSGASHGGSGGSSSSEGKPLVTYVGYVFTADEFGSAGGNKTTGGIGGLGGGIVKLKVTDTLILSGMISSHGIKGNNSGGGGSGGSVSIETVDMLGSGSVSVIGGNSTSGGGGGGGRVYMYCTGDYNYTGTYKLKGGNSDTAQAGGAGTAFLKFTSGNILYHKLLTDNTEITGKSIAATHIDTPGTSSVEVDEMEVGDKTTIKFTTAGLHFTASVLVCGSESYLVVQDNVIFNADIESSYSKLTCSLHIEELGEARLPKTVELLGADNQFKGTLTNIQTLIVSSGQEATFSKITRTATYKDGVLTAQEVGAYRFARFIIKDYATVTFETTGKVLQLTILELHYGSTLKGERILLQSNEILLQPGSTIDLSGGGYAAEQGPGKGLQISGEDLATGAGYASPGGSPSESNTGGDIYNLARVPGEEGSGGGNSNSGVGGAGGGYLKIETFYDLTNYGVIKVDGASATGSGAGGGSGGTVVANCRNLLGDGTLSVNGGQGSGKGGGGSGGRMKFIFTQSFDFDGTMTAYGGGNDDNLNTVKAGAGTIYIQDGTGNSLMNRLWIIGDTESSVQKQTHTLISGTTSNDFYYNVLSLKGYSYADIEGATTLLRIDNINGDNTGTMNVQNQQILKAEVFEGEQRHFITNINIDLAEQATLHVPLNMTVSGCTVTLKGRVTLTILLWKMEVQLF